MGTSLKGKGVGSPTAVSRATVRVFNPALLQPSQDHRERVCGGDSWDFRLKSQNTKYCNMHLMNYKQCLFLARMKSLRIIQRLQIQIMIVSKKIYPKHMVLNALAKVKSLFCPLEDDIQMGLLSCLSPY